MEVVWFCLVAGMLAMYVVFDGFDLGAGAIHLLAARTDDERRLVLRSIGPVWDGNEVWLVAAGATLYFAFPALYAVSFSGFYLPLMIVLWLLILRGTAIELRNHIDSPAWIPFWDVIFSCSSLLLIVFLGAALGNVVRGVPLDDDGWFFAPLWTNFGVGPEPGILDWYTVTVGVAALFALVLHGSLWVWMKAAGPLEDRTRRIAGHAWVGTGIFSVLVTALTLRIQPQVGANLSRHGWGWVFPLSATAGWLGVRWYLARANQKRAFLASCVSLIGMLSSVAFGLFPFVLPSITDPARSLTVHNAAAADHGLRVALIWWIPGMALVAGYFCYTYRHFAGKVTPEGDGY